MINTNSTTASHPINIMYSSLKEHIGFKGIHGQSWDHIAIMFLF
jgi:hypothetical protein